MLKESVLNVEVSCFRNYDTPQNPVPVNLMKWLTSTKYKDKVEAIRSIDDKKKRDAIKATLPAITPSGIFSYRSQSNLINHSGLIQIDIDLSPKNKLISNWEDLKSELTKLPQIAYLGKSVSGRGYWGLIPIPPDPDGHKLYFDSLKEIFLKNWGIELDDKPKNVASLRGYSFDAEAYFNHQAKPYLIKKLPQPKQFQTVKNTGIKASGLGDWIIKKLEASPEGQRHGDRFDLARIAGGLVANGYLDPQICESLIQSYLNQYDHIDSHHTQTKEIKAIQDGFKDGLKYPIHPPQVNCLFVPINRFEDYSEKSFKIWQGIKFYFIPKSQVYEIMESGFYISESFLRSDLKSPKCQGMTKEFNFDAVCQFQPTPTQPPNLTTNPPAPEDYISQLYFENGLLLNGDGYPAEWDLAGSYTDDKTKDFIRMTAKNPALIKLREKFDLS